MHGLAKAGDIISFSKASVLIAELNEVQGRWSVDLMGAHKDRVVEQYCPFPAEGQEEPEEGRHSAAGEDESFAAGSVDGDVDAGGVVPLNNPRPVEGIRMAKFLGLGKRKHNQCPFHVRIASTGTRRQLRRTAAIEIDVSGEGIIERCRTSDTASTSMATESVGRSSPQPSEGSVAPSIAHSIAASVDSRGHLSGAALALVSGADHRRKKQKVGVPDLPEVLTDPAEIEISITKHTCNPHNLPRINGRICVQREDGVLKLKARATAYSQNLIEDIVRPVVASAQVNTSDKEHVHAAAMELHKYLYLPRRAEANELHQIKSIASKAVHTLLQEKAVSRDFDCLYAQAYAAELRALGHHASVHIVDAARAHLCRQRVAVSAHNAAQRRLQTRDPFDEAAYLRKYPRPGKDEPNVATGYAASPAYMRGATFGDFQPVWYMDVGAGRGDSAFNLFHTGLLDGDHHCHPLVDNWMIEAESEAAWRPFLKNAVEEFPMMNDERARVTKDDHIGSHAACRKEAPQAVTFTCAVHRRRHYASDARYGSGESRRLLIQWYDGVVRCPHYPSTLVQIAVLKNNVLTQKAWQAVKKTPMEELIPSMRHQPTNNTTRMTKPGPMFNEVTSNEAECTMSMMLPVRNQVSLATHQHMYWELRFRRWRTTVAKLRRAQANDSSIHDRLRGLTPYVLHKINAAEGKATSKCQVKNVAGLTCEVNSASSPATYHKIDLTSPLNVERMCSNGCMENRVGVCHHIACFVLATPALHYRDLLPRSEAK